MAKGKLRMVQTAFSTYRLGGVLGEGGAGIVYEATDESDKPWAVKLLDPKRATSERRKRFKNEILFSERTRHPNIVPIVDHGVTVPSEGTAPFYVMPRYAGSLRAAMKSLGDAPRRLRYFDQILSGVEAAHLVGVIHRDIKPENIFMGRGRDGLVVGDFGIAHFTDEELYTAAETRDDRRLANFLYAAPEQRLRGEKVDARADVYAPGLLLNELFTGSVPHGTAYRLIGSMLPEYAWLDALVDTMLRQHSNERPASIEDVKRALIAYKQDYVVCQRLDELQNLVVPTTAVTDPLADAPLRLVDYGWANEKLTLILSGKVNQEWVQAFKTFNYRRAMMGKEPRMFSISGNRASIAAPEHEIQRTIDYLKEWLPLVRDEYRARLEARLRDAEARNRAAALAKQQELERRKRVRDSIRL